MKVKKLLYGILATLIVVMGFIIPVGAAQTATLTVGNVSAHSGVIVDTFTILTQAWNSSTSARNVYFDFKYYNGSSWKKDKNAADLDPNDSIHDYIYSSTKVTDMSWKLQINTWNCWYNDCYASGSIV